MRVVLEGNLICLFSLYFCADRYGVYYALGVYICNLQFFKIIYIYIIMLVSLCERDAY